MIEQSVARKRLDDDVLRQLGQHKGVERAVVRREANVFLGERLMDFTVMDWFSMILELAEIDPPKVPLDGKSMLPLIRDARAPIGHNVLHFGWTNEWAVREGDWKLIGSISKSEPGRFHKSLYHLFGIRSIVSSKRDRSRWQRSTVGFRFRFDGCRPNDSFESRRLRFRCHSQVRQ